MLQMAGNYSKNGILMFEFDVWASLLCNMPCIRKKKAT